MKKNNFADVNYRSTAVNWEKPILRRHFFYAGENYLFAKANREKPILRRHFITKAKKIELQGLETNRMKETYKKR